MTTNQLAYWKLQEEQRSNLAREREAVRSNKMNEALKNKETAVKSGQLALDRSKHRWNMFQDVANRVTDTIQRPTDNLIKLFSGIGKLLK